MYIKYTIHQSVWQQFADQPVTVRGDDASRMVRYLSKYERSTGPFTGFYPSLGITVNEVAL